MIFRPIAKVSRLQVRLASFLTRGATIVRREDIGCTQQTWRLLRAESGLETVDAHTCRATPTSAEWVYNVRCHLALRKSRPQLVRKPRTDRDRLQRKILRAARAGLIDTTQRGDG